MKTARRLAAILLGGLLATTVAWADDYPDKPIRLVIPFAAGGPTDELGRAVAKSLSEVLKQPVIVYNRTGAGGSIGMDSVAKSPPDGYTIGMGHTGSNSINPFLYDKLPYDSLKDFAPITPVVSYTNVLVVNPLLPVHSVAEFIEWAKANPAKATFASGGIGATNHLSGEILKSLTGAPLVHIPYKGNAPAMLDVIGGSASSMFDILITVVPQVKAGKVRPLAVTSRERSRYLPTVPTMREAGLPAYDEAGNDLWFGLFAPAKTPPAIVARLHDAVITAMKTPELQQQIRAMYYEPWTLSSNDFATFLRTDQEKWQKVVLKSGAKAQ